jgi:ABC-type multidrug transport system permease subunit
MVETAWIIQDDLKKDYYGGNSFDIGEFEPTIPGILSKVHKAIIAGLFRPFIWEGKRSFLMLLSGLESLLLMVMIAYVLFKYRIIKIFSMLLSDALMLSFFVLALTFAFSVGLTTANFGALVRYVIPAKIIMVIVMGHLIYKVHDKQKPLI